MVNEWVEILDECRDNPEISAIILTGAGEAFCAGGDKANLGANNKIDPLETKDHFWDHFQRIAKRTALIEKPIVAAVNGMTTIFNPAPARSLEKEFLDHVSWLIPLKKFFSSD